MEIEELNPGAGAIPSMEQASPATVHQIFESVIMNNETFHGDVQKFQNVSGSIIATDSAKISSSHASCSSAAEVIAAFNVLKSYMDDVSNAQRAGVTESIDLLAAAIEDSSIPKSRIVAAAETIATASDRMKRGLRDLSIGVTGSMTASAIWEGVRYALGADS